MTQRKDGLAEQDGARPDGAAKGFSRQAVDGAKWVFLGMIFQTLLRLAVIAVLARLLTPAEFGVMAAAMVVIALGEIRLGAGAALVQLQDIRDSHVGCAFYITVAIGGSLGVFVFAMSDVLERFLRLEGVAEPLQLLAVTFPIRSISQTSMRLLQRRLAFRILAIFDSIAYLIGYGIVGIGLALNQQGVWALVWAYLVMCIVSLFLICLASRKDFSFRFERAAFRELVIASGGISLLSLLHYALSNLVQVFIARALGATALGIYSRGMDLTNRVSNIFDRLVSSILFPVYSRLQDDQKRIAAGFKQGLLAVAMITLPSTSAMILLAPEIVLTVLGSQWSNAIPVFQVLSIALIFRIGIRMAIALASGFGRFYSLAWIQFWTLSGLAVLLLVTVPLGLVAVAWAYTASTLVGCVVSMRMALRLSGISFPEFMLVLCRCLPLTVATSVVVIVSREGTAVMLNESAGLGLVAIIVATGLVIGAAVLLVPSLALTESGRRLIGRVLDNLFPRSDPFGFKRTILR